MNIGEEQPAIQVPEPVRPKREQSPEPEPQAPSPVKEPIKQV